MYKHSPLLKQDIPPKAGCKLKSQISAWGKCLGTGNSRKGKGIKAFVMFHTQLRCENVRKTHSLSLQQPQPWHLWGNPPWVNLILNYLNISGSLSPDWMLIYNTIKVCRTLQTCICVLHCDYKILAHSDSASWVRSVDSAKGINSRINSKVWEGLGENSQDITMWFLSWWRNPSHTPFPPGTTPEHPARLTPFPDNTQLAG